MKLTAAKGYPLTDQNNAPAKASKKADGALPSKGAASVTRGQSFKASGTDGTPLSVESHGDSLTAGHSLKSAKGRMPKSTTTSEVSQAIRRRQKVSSYP